MNIITQKTMDIPFFIKGRIFGFSIILLILLISLYYIWTKKKVPIRLLPQVEAMRESVGRCAEMGKPLVYTYGNPTSGVDYWTVASFGLLKYTAEQAAKLGVKVIIPLSASPKSVITHAIVRDIMKEAYIAAGTSEMYDEANFILTGTDDQTWGLAVTKILYAARPAAHFYLGFIPFFSVIFGETSTSIGGCVSIGSSFYLQMIAMTVVSCDYTFIAQDLIAASAYVTEDPSQGGFLRTIDSISFISMILVAISSILLTMGINIIPWLGV